MRKTYFAIVACLAAMLLFFGAAEARADSAMSISVLEHNFFLAESYIRSNVPANAVWSLSFASLETDESFTAGSSGDVSLAPASLIKLLVAAAVLDADSAERIDIDTVVARDGSVVAGELKGDLYMKGYGNAFLSEEDLERAVSEIIQTGIVKVNGDIVVDDSYFDVKSKRPGNGPAYAIPSAVGLDLHTASINVSDGGRNVSVRPSNDEVKTDINLLTEDIQKINDLIYEVPSKEAYRRFPLDDPALYAAGTFKSLLAKNGIAVNGHVIRGRMPSSAMELYRLEAEPISKVIKDTNFHSLNVVAENLLLLLGSKRFGPPGTEEKGISALREFLDENGLPTDAVEVVDGSGLSFSNKASSSFMVEFLKGISGKPWFDSFYTSLPRAGMEGTLSGISFKNREVRAKTGQTERVYSIAGYIEDPEEGLVAFSLIVNIPGADLLRGITGPLLARLAGDISEVH